MSASRRALPSGKPARATCVCATCAGPRMWKKRSAASARPCQGSWPELGSLRRRDHTLLQDEAAVEAALAGCDGVIALLRALIERKAFDRTHRPRVASGIALRHRINRGLGLLLNGREFVRIADDLHALCGIFDEAVERHQREDGADSLGRADIVRADQPAVGRLARD